MRCSSCGSLLSTDNRKLPQESDKTQSEHRQVETVENYAGIEGAGSAQEFPVEGQRMYITMKSRRFCTSE